MNIENEIYNRLVFFDGAMGTTLQKKGLKTGEVPEKLNFTHPELIAAIHREYAEAGAEIIKTNTFGASRYKLSHANLMVNEVVTQAVKLAKQGAPSKLIALDIGPIGQMLAPVGSLAFDDAYSMFKEQVEAGVNAGADLILIETVSDLYEAKAAILAAKENSSLPVFCTMTFQEDGRTLTGTDPETLVTVLESLGVDALGVNCSLGPHEVFPIIEQIMKFASIPVIVQPNAGLPILEDGITKFLVTPTKFVEEMKKILDLGVHVVGGCCGTTPEFINLLTQEYQNFIPAPIISHARTTCSSPSQTVEIGSDVVIIGERINPTGKKRIKAALREGDIDFLLQEAIQQKEAGAQVLDVNVGIPEIDEVETLPRLVSELQEIVDLPLQFDCSNIQALEKACRYYNGKPIINSVNGKAKNMAELFPLVKKYGCLVIGLCMDERGLPKTIGDRVEIAEKIIKTAKSYGIPSENLLIDCLTLTASAQPESVQHSLQALRIIKEKFGVKTTLGASNVSYGFPARTLLNRTYLAMALQSGLNAPITDPLNSDIMQTIDSFRVLNNFDLGGKNFIEKYRNYSTYDQHIGKTNNQNSNQGTETQTDTLYSAIITGMKSKVGSLTHSTLEEKTPMEIVDTILIPALDEVGRNYETKEIFLPQLIRSAETVKISFEVLKQKLIDIGASSINKGTIVLATVEGDVHDIGKNIVKILLENYGYHVIDLGRDVSPEKIVSIVQEQDIQLVGLSALMTTTVISMKSTIEALHAQKLSCKIMVGGAVLSESFSKEIGADFYGKDAKSAVEIAKKCFP